MFQSCYEVRGSVCFLLRELQEMGAEVHRKMRNELNEYRGHKKQFLMATIMSTKELEERDCSVLHKFQQYLSTVQDMVDKQKLTSKRLIHHGRCIFILNMLTEKDYTHVEARLLDPTGEIRHKLKIGNPLTDDDKHDAEFYMDQMRGEFYNQYPDNFRPSLVIFSYNAPCTCAKNNCALVVSEFGKAAKENVYVGYSHVFSTTDEEMSVRLMESAGVHVVQPGDFRCNAVSTYACDRYIHQETYQEMEDQCLASMTDDQAPTVMNGPIDKKENKRDVLSSLSHFDQKNIIKRLKRKQSKQTSKRLMSNLHRN